MTDAYIGAETGALKGLNFSTNTFQNYNEIRTLDRTQEISRMCRFRTVNDSGNDESNGFEEGILCALVNRQLKLFDPSTNSYKILFTCEGGRGPVRGIEQLVSNKIITCVESGELAVWNTESCSKEITINVGDSICRMRHCPTKNNIVATGGRENPLKLWDLEKPQQTIFTVKNVKNDNLDLRVPIWETDFRFSTSNDCVFTCTGHHHIRMYDPRSNQRRPMVQIQWGDYPFTSISLTPRENQVIAGNTQGYMGLFDMRGKGDSKLVHCYRGFAGSISAIECHESEPYVASCGIDRFARLHHLFTKDQLNKIYCKSRLNCMILSNDLTISQAEPHGDVDQEDVSYRSDDDQLSDDNIWNEMPQVKDRKKRTNRSSGSDVDSESADSGVEEKKVKKKKPRQQLIPTLPIKREPSPSLPSKLKKRKKRRSGEGDAMTNKRKRKSTNGNGELQKKIKISAGFG